MLRFRVQGSRGRVSILGKLYVQGSVPWPSSVGSPGCGIRVHYSGCRLSLRPPAWAARFRSSVKGCRSQGEVWILSWRISQTAILAEFGVGALVLVLELTLHPASKRYLPGGWLTFHRRSGLPTNYRANSAACSCTQATADSHERH